MHRRKFGHRTASRKGRLLNFRVTFNPWRRSKKARAQFRPGWGAMRTIRPNSASAWVWPAEQPHGLGEDAELAFVEAGTREVEIR